MRGRMWRGWCSRQAFIIAALALLFRTVRLNAEDRKTGFLLALSSTPFLFETWIGGQMSVVVFSIWVLFFWCLENDRRVLAGFVLALCLFKPTLVALPALMLVVGRRWRVVGGFVAGGIAMALLSVATVGLDGCRALVRGFGDERESWWLRPTKPRHQAKYVDLLAFYHLLFPNPAVLADRASLVAVTSRWSGWGWHGGGRMAIGTVTPRAALGRDAVLHSGG